LEVGLFFLERLQALFFKPDSSEILFANLAGFKNLRGLKQKDCSEWRGYSCHEKSNR